VKEVLSSFSDTAILAKIRAMYGRRLTQEDYTELLHKQTVGDAAAYLKNETHYREVLNKVQENQIHRAHLENLVQMEIYRQYQRLLEFHKGNNAFYLYILKDIEIRILIRRIGLYYAGREAAPETIASLPTYLEKRLSFDLLRLARAKDFGEMLKVLERTEYVKILKPFLPAPGERPSLLDCETALKTFYFDDLFRKIDQLYHGRTKKDLYSVFLTQLELLNVTTILRMKRFQHYSPKEIQAQLLPSHSRLSEKLWRQMAEAPDASESMRILSASSYAKYIDDKNFMFIEYTVDSIRYHLSKRFMRYTAAAPTGFAAYMVMCRIERENITNIIEGIRYQVAPEEMEKLIIQ